ncbi:MAG: hypothetical protein V4534_01650 [Myxococcota bacterium]
MTVIRLFLLLHLSFPASTQGNQTAVIYTKPVGGIYSALEIGSVYFAVGLILTAPALTLAGRHHAAAKGETAAATMADNPFTLAIAAMTTPMSVFMFNQWIVNWISAYSAWRFAPPDLKSVKV